MVLYAIASVAANAIYSIAYFLFLKKKTGVLSQYWITVGIIQGAVAILVALFMVVGYTFHW